MTVKAYVEKGIDMAMNLSSIFLGGVPSEQRKYLRAILEHYRSLGYKKVHIPCTGQFTIVKCAIEAGFEKHNIFSSDVCLFSTVLGYLYSGQPIDEIDLTIVDGELYDLYKQEETDVAKAAWLFLAMKMAQLRQDVYYERTFFNEINVRKKHYHEKMVTMLKQYVERYGGVQYEIKDVRDYFNKEYVQSLGDDTLVIMNPPAYTHGYTKMFIVDEYIKFQWPVEEFDFGKEWMNCYQWAANEVEVPYLWYTSQQVVKQLPEEHIVYAHEDGKDRFSYFLVPKYEQLKGFKEGLYKVKFKRMGTLEDATQYKLYPRDRDLNPETDKITIRQITKETALYYRDLFAHRLGSTVAEVYFGVFVNEYLMSASGFNTSFLRRMQENYIFENFCFSISHDKYENLNRMAMMCLVSGEFKKFLYNDTLRGSSYVQLLTFRTVCLTKYRKSKLNVGLLTLLSSERQENNTYKLVYEQPFYLDRTYADCMRIYLEQDVRYKKNKNDKSDEE